MVFSLEAVYHLLCACFVGLLEGGDYDVVGHGGCRGPEGVGRLYFGSGGGVFLFDMAYDVDVAEVFGGHVLFFACTEQAAEYQNFYAGFHIGNFSGKYREKMGGFPAGRINFAYYLTAYNLNYEKSLFCSFRSFVFVGLPA